MDATRFLPLSRDDIIRHVDGGADFRRFANLLHHNMRHDSDASERVRAAYAPFDPDPLYPVLPGHHAPFLAAFERMMEDANFQRISKQELQEAFDEKSLFPLHAEVDLDEYDILQLYRRGIGHRTERVRGPSTLYRWKKRELVLYERLVILVRLKDSVLAGNRTTRMEGMEPGKMYIKSFKNIPTADVEMVLPNTRLRMRRMDRILVGGPLIAGVGLTLFNSIGILIAIAAGAFVLSLDDPKVRAFGGVLLVLAGYLWKTHSKIKTTRLRYLQTLSDGLYFRNLANNAAVIDQVLGFAAREEEKEALLAFALLQGGALTRKKLDAAAESWLLRHTARRIDFDCADGLESLTTLGLAHRRMGRWHALDVAGGAAALAKRWDQLL